MIRNIITFVLVAALGLAIWRIVGSGGDVVSFFNMIWGFIFSVIDAVAQVIENIFNTLFGSGQ
jgi:hypothetical protein